MTCIIQAPPGSYEFVLPEFANDVEINQVKDVKVEPSEKLQALLDEIGLSPEMRLDVEYFDKFYNFHIQLIFESDADAVLFKLQWEQ
jgi:hypothetical protein